MTTRRGFLGAMLAAAAAPAIVRAESLMRIVVPAAEIVVPVDVTATLETYGHFDPADPLAQRIGGEAYVVLMHPSLYDDLRLSEAPQPPKLMGAHVVRAQRVDPLGERGYVDWGPMLERPPVMNEHWMESAWKRDEALFRGEAISLEDIRVVVGKLKPSAVRPVRASQGDIDADMSRALASVVDRWRT